MSQNTLIKCDSKYTFTFYHVMSVCFSCFPEKEQEEVEVEATEEGEGELSEEEEGRPVRVWETVFYFEKAVSFQFL